MCVLYANKLYLPSSSSSFLSRLNELIIFGGYSAKFLKNFHVNTNSKCSLNKWKEIFVKWKSNGTTTTTIIIAVCERKKRYVRRRWNFNTSSECRHCRCNTFMYSSHILFTHKQRQLCLRCLQKCFYDYKTLDVASISLLNLQYLFQ